MTPRASTAMEIISGGVGLLLGVAGGFFLWLEMKSPPTHTMHVYVFVGLMVLGALMIAPAAIVNGIRGIAPYVPFLPKPGIGAGVAPSNPTPPNPAPPTGGA